MLEEMEILEKGSCIHMNTVINNFYNILNDEIIRA